MEVSTFTAQESCALYGLLAETTSDIILRTDDRGFIRHASQAISDLGIQLPSMLIWPHVSDLVHRLSKDIVRHHHAAALAGDRDAAWFECRCATQDGSERWFEMRFRGLADERDGPYGALCVMRSIDEKRHLEDKLFIAAMTDPLTGLTNGPAFTTMLRHLVDERVGGWLALFEIDHFQAIRLRYGHSVGDDILMVFAEFLRTLLRADDIISRVGDETFAVLLPSADARQAATMCRRIVRKLDDIRATAAPGSLTITASVGMAVISGSLDNTLRRAELATFSARAQGGNRLESECTRRFARQERLPL